MSNSKCSKCGVDVAGKFCPECGTPSGGNKCHSCNAEIKPGTKFCPGCGTPTAGGNRNPGPASISNRMPWIIAGSSIVLLFIVAIAKTGLTDRASVAANQAPRQAAGPGTATTDLSSMSPREAANRLFNRIMVAAERGDTDEVAQFTPMAVQAYRMLGTLDADARYDLGMILSMGSDLEGALAQADTIEQSFPNHLLAKVVRVTVAQIRGDEENLNRGYQEFLAAYDAETAIDRPEYQAHQRTVTSFNEEARANTQ
jgi:hypothetical protein